jgi:hypothetical protein
MSVLDEPAVLYIDEGKGLVPIVTIRNGHIDNVDAMRAIVRGAKRAEIRRGDYLQYAIAPSSATSHQYWYRTSVGGPFFGELAELPEMVARLEARSDRGY